MDLVTLALHCKAKYVMNLKLDPTILDAEDLILLSKSTKTMDIGMCTVK